MLDTWLIGCSWIALATVGLNALGLSLVKAFFDRKEELLNRMLNQRGESNG